jgi:Na+-transporting NADH:ubiquinone oxidoreductase subunit C
LDRKSNAYLVTFALGICVVCSAALALTFNGLSETIAGSRSFDIQKNILKAVGLWNPHTEGARPRKELEQIYRDSVTRLVIERESGKVVEGRSDADLALLLKADRKKTDFRNRAHLEIYKAVRDGNEYWVLPTLAYGLWSWMHGFLAVDRQGREVVGITYYDQGETPGLGGEVENPAWQESWHGKKLYDAQGELVSVTVKKGTISKDDPKELAHFVDGLAGATITSNGVTRDLKKVLEAYRPFFERIRKQ